MRQWIVLVWQPLLPPRLVTTQVRYALTAQCVPPASRNLITAMLMSFDIRQARSCARLTTAL